MLVPVRRTPRPRRTRAVLAVVAAAVALVAGCGRGTATPPVTGTVAPAAGVRALEIEVVERFPHDDEAYTQGLLAGPDGQLFESTGKRGRSTVRRVDLASGDVVASADLPAAYFGEGLAQVGDRLVQLTWQEGRALVWDADSLEQVDEWAYEGEGWGLCLDDAADPPRLVMSDGSATLTLRDPETFATLGRVPVTQAGAPVTLLNELECVAGRVWANVYRTDSIVEIDLATGAVLSVVDARGLLSDEERADADVLNGIAVEPGGGDTFLVTGKDWPWLFRVRFVPAG